MYVKPNCPKCVFVKSALKKAGVEYNTVDVTENDEAYRSVVALGVKELPVTLHVGVWYSGVQQQLDLAKRLANK